MRLICHKYGIEIVPESEVESFYLEQFRDPVARLNHIREESYNAPAHADEDGEVEVTETISLTIQ